MMRPVMAIDPGLRSLGLVVVDTDGTSHELRHIGFHETQASSVSRFLSDERVARARTIRPWLRRILELYHPCAIVIEDFGFLRGQHATACLAMAYASIIAAIDEHGEKYHQVPVVGARASVWRDELAGLAGKRAGKKETRAEREARTADRERRAHAAAMRRVLGASRSINELPAKQSVHVLDALGLFCWGVTQKPVQAAVWGGRV